MVAAVMDRQFGRTTLSKHTMHAQTPETAVAAAGPAQGTPLLPVLLSCSQVQCLQHLKYAQACSCP
jgi:hypothetical protein